MKKVILKILKSIIIEFNIYKITKTEKEEIIKNHVSNIKFN
jgi:hypothetical protein